MILKSWILSLSAQKLILTQFYCMTHASKDQINRFNVIGAAGKFMESIWNSRVIYKK